MSELLNEHLKPSPDPRSREPNGQGTSKPPSPAAGVRADQDLFRELMDRFTVLAETCARFSSEVYRRSGTPIESDVEGTVRRNLTIAQTVFSKWSLEILAVIYLSKSIRLRDLRRALGIIAPRTLTTKLRKLEKAGLVQREDDTKEPSEGRYYLTHKGLMITRLGEPVFLYLRLADGWRAATEREAEAREAGEAPVLRPIRPL